jgi:hypothetical protein
MVKRFITLVHGSKLKHHCGTVVIYRGILTIENVSTAVNYHGIFITLALRIYQIAVVLLSLPNPAKACQSQTL